MKLIILIPAFNEEKTIGQVIDDIPAALLGIDERQIVVVDDGSSDRTGEIAEMKGAVIIRCKKNRGLGMAFQSGLEKALELGADILITIDADMQFSPGEIPKLIKPILNGEADFVTGSRFIDRSFVPKNMPWIKQWGNHRVAEIISWATGVKFCDVSCGFRAYSLESMLRLNIFGNFTYTQETFLDLSFKGLAIAEIPVTVRYFDDRESRVAGSIVAYAIKSADIIFRAIKDYYPLRFFGWTGFAIFMVGFFCGVFSIFHYILSGAFSPFKAVALAGAFFCSIGILVFFIGILADLIGNIRLTQEKILYYKKKRLYGRR